MIYIWFYFTNFIQQNNTCSKWTKRHSEKDAELVQIINWNICKLSITNFESKESLVWVSPFLHLNTHVTNKFRKSNEVTSTGLGDIKNNLSKLSKVPLKECCFCCSFSAHCNVTFKTVFYSWLGNCWKGNLFRKTQWHDLRLKQ